MLSASAPLLARGIALAATGLTLAGLGYFAAAFLAARRFAAERRRPLPAFAPGVTVMKSLKGLDPGMLDAFRTHCRQQYAGPFELLFGVSSPDDPAAAAVRELQAEFPALSIRLIVCPEQLGSSGKVSTLIQLARQAQYEFLLVNDSDITVSPRYFERILAPFASARVGLVTALYRGRAHQTLPSHLESLGIAADFQAGVLLSKWIEGGIRYGLGSTLAVRREALAKIGGFEAIANCLADDYELGARVAAAGFEVVLSGEVVETGVAPYRWRGYFDHQIRWARTVRDARPGGYIGLIFTHGFAWAVVNLIAAGLSPLSVDLLVACLFLRLLVAFAVGRSILADEQLPSTYWLLPLRDLIFFGIWIAGFAGDTIVWRGQRFRLVKGRLFPV